MKERRVVITGIGVITPVGKGKDEFWGNLIDGKSGIGEITRFDTTDFPAKIAGEVKDFDPGLYMDKKEAKRMDRFSQYAVAATKLAFEDAGLDKETINPFRSGAVIGSGIGGIDTFEEQHKTLLEKGVKRVSPFMIPMMIVNMASAQVAINFNLKGPNFSTVTACAAGTNALGEAFRTIKVGAADIMVAGGTEASITPISVAGFCSMRALSTRNDDPQGASRPFSADRDGFVMAEGSGVLILESLEHALERGANIYAEFVGYGATCDASHITAPAENGEGGARAMQAAIDEAGIKPEEVDYINAHGTSTDLNDKFETMGIKTVFGEKPGLVVSSTKSMTGHLLGAAGGIEAAVIALAIKNGVVPPTINLEEASPECDLDYVPNVKRDMKDRVALSNSLGFGGHNATVAFKEYIG